MTELNKCPACGSATAELVAGVCPRCKKNFEHVHRKNLNTKWSPEDFRYHSPHHAQPGIPDEAVEEAASDEGFTDEQIEAKDYYKRAIRLAVQYKGNKTQFLYAMCYAFEWFDVIECETAVDIAVKLFGDPKKKAAVTKNIKLIQDALGVEPGRGQRSEKGREQMAKARTNQLKGTK